MIWNETDELNAAVRRLKNRLITWFTQTRSSARRLVLMTCTCRQFFFWRIDEDEIYINDNNDKFENKLFNLILISIWKNCWKNDYHQTYHFQNMKAKNWSLLLIMRIIIDNNRECATLNAHVIINHKNSYESQYLTFSLWWS